MIKLNKVSKIFPTGVAGLSDVSLSIDKGEFAFITGTTGSGKTTLLKVIIREVLPTEGDVLVADVDVVNLAKKNIPHFRKKIGIIFQDLKLLSDRTILENVLLPLEIAGVSPVEAQQKAEDLLEDVGLSEHRNKFPIQLSGGELQRVAIARALTLAPEIIIADEPTGNLDNDTALSIVELLHAINKKGTTILMVTHNTGIVDKYADHRVVILEKGKVVKDTKAKSTEHRAIHSAISGRESEENDQVSMINDQVGVGETSPVIANEMKQSSTNDELSASQQGGRTTGEGKQEDSKQAEKHDKKHAHKIHESEPTETVADVFSGSIEEKIETKKGKK